MGKRKGGIRWYERSPTYEIVAHLKGERGGLASRERKKGGKGNEESEQNPYPRPVAMRKRVAPSKVVGVARGAQPCEIAEHAVFLGRPPKTQTK